MEDQLQEGTGEGHLRQMVSSPSMKNITRDHIKNLLIPLPSLGEQKLIVKMQNCNELEKSIKQSTAQNEKLLQQVLREGLKISN